MKSSNTKRIFPTYNEKFHLNTFVNSFEHFKFISLVKFDTRLLLLLVDGGAKEEQQRLNLSGTLCRPSIWPITIFHRFFFFCSD